MRSFVVSILLLVCVPSVLNAAAKFPAPDFRTGYQMPTTETSPVRAAWRGYVDVGVLAGALSVGAWLVFKKRSRRGIFWLTVFSVAYFGFYRKGCICPVGSIQDVALAGGNNGYALPWGVAAFFALPLLFTLFYGRVFCAGVCPLGAIQDVVLWKPIHLPPWVESVLGLFAYVYLGLAVMFAALGSDFVICRYDPFVGLFRLSAPAHMLLLGAVFLIVSMFVGRVYCRFICPYSVLLRLLSPFSRQRVSITPAECVDCRLCEKSCPFGAIRSPTPREAPRRDAGKRQLAVSLTMLPLILALFAGIGYLSSGAMSRVDVTVRLAERVWQEEHQQVAGFTNETKAFRGTGETIERLYGDALAMRRKYALAGSLFGAWVGLVVGLKLVRLVMRRRQTGWTADPAGCVACARCYSSCPVEHERRQERELVAV